MIELKQLRKEFDQLCAVDDLDLVIPDGEVFGLIGPNGAGKTTTIRMMCGLMTPTSGSVSIEGVDVHEDPEKAQSNIGYLSDFFAVYEDLKVWEYLDHFARAYKMPEAEAKSRIEEVIGQVRLEVKRDQFIKGLSRGMKQRLGIARAVIHKPKVLLLDEPASGLDPKARIDLRNLLLELRNEGTTVLISSHILSELEGFCTSIGLMEKGQMIRCGRIESIAAQEATHRAVRMRWLGGDSVTQAVEATLGGTALVLSHVVTGNEAAFAFSGDEKDLAALLRAMTAAGIPVVAFGEVKQTVEDLYLRLSRHEVM